LKGRGFRRTAGTHGFAGFSREALSSACWSETVFSAAKRKLSCRAPGRCLLTQHRQALLLGLTYNLYRL
jgi:hypothetical protein